MKTLSCLVLTLAAAAGQTIDRTKPPQTPELPAYHLPPVSESKLVEFLTASLSQSLYIEASKIDLDKPFIDHVKTRFRPLDLHCLPHSLELL